MRINDIDIGSLISFRSKNANDLTEWRGKLEAKGNYTLARGYSNPAPEHQAVRQADPSIPISEFDLNYFLITVDNSAAQPTLRIFAEEWIEAGSLTQINLGTMVTVEVMDNLNNPQAILSILASVGYATKIVPNR